jgi:4-hydroxybenzoate polyprenyltransferase
MKLRAYLELMRLHRPIGSLLLLWPTLWALWIASEGHPSLKLIVIFVAGVFCMRSAGCVINDIADRNLDGFVSRTKNRPLVTGQVKLKQALVLFCMLCAMSLLLVIQLNLLTIALSTIALALAVIYPFMKRFTYWPQVVLGMAFAWAIPMVFAATLTKIPPITWLVYAIGVIWPLAYDTQYAMTDREDDIKIGIKSTAIIFGRYDRGIILVLQLLILVLLGYLGFYLRLNSWFYLALGLVTLLFCYQQYLIKDRDPALCFRAFLNNNWVGLIIFLGIGLSFIEFSLW